MMIQSSPFGLDIHHLNYPIPITLGLACQYLRGGCRATKVSCTEIESADQTRTCESERSGKKEPIVWNSQASRKFDVPKVR